MEDIKEFEKLVMPISEYLIKKYGKHATAIITDEIAKIVVDDISTPIKETNSRELG